MIKLTIKLNTVDDVKELLNEVSKIKEDIDIIKGRLVIDAKSTVGMFTLDLYDPVEICIHSTDLDLLEPFKKWSVE